MERKRLRKISSVADDNDVVVGDAVDDDDVADDDDGVVLCAWRQSRIMPLITRLGCVPSSVMHI